LLPDYRVRQRDYLLEIARAITQELDIDKLLVRILRLTAELLAGQAGVIALRDDEGGWKLGVSHGISPSLLRYLDPLLSAVPVITKTLPGSSSRRSIASCRGSRVEPALVYSPEWDCL
jgi:GAF domain-containing protein